mmetsp:Transcript_26181/g.59843  ORF Transcript_26181/g.59843 Transcript_26181/m.59843 type:complete len:202 (-) Transcript_26181:1484-2089(-)
MPSQPVTFSFSSSCSVSPAALFLQLDPGFIELDSLSLVARPTRLVVVKVVHSYLIAVPRAVYIVENKPIAETYFHFFAWLSLLLGVAQDELSDVVQNRPGIHVEVSALPEELLPRLHEAHLQLGLLHALAKRHTVPVERVAQMVEIRVVEDDAQRSRRVSRLHPLPADVVRHPGKHLEHVRIRRQQHGLGQLGSVYTGQCV